MLTHSYSSLNRTHHYHLHLYALSDGCLDIDLDLDGMTKMEVEDEEVEVLETVRDRYNDRCQMRLQSVQSQCVELSYDYDST